MTTFEFCRQVLTQVRFLPDHDAILQELKGHIEDRKEALLSRGLSKPEAEDQAVAAMGDPAELGKALNREHHWLAGWVMIWFHRLFVTGMVCLALLALGQARDTAANLLPHWEQGYVFNEWTLNDSDVTYDQQISQGALLDFRPEVSVRTDDYTFTVTRAVVRNEGEFRTLRYILRVVHWNPWNAAPEFRGFLSAVDDLGNWYPGWEADPAALPGEAGRLGDSAGNCKAAYCFTSYYEMWVTGIKPGASELTLVYDRAGHQIHLTLPLTGEESS